MGERYQGVLDGTIKWVREDFKVYYGEIVGVKLSMESIIFSSNAIKM